MPGNGPLSRFAASLEVKQDRLAKEAADRLAAELKATVHVRTGHMQRSVTVTKIANGVYDVHVDDEGAWYENYGTVTTNHEAHPFWEPSIERTKAALPDIGYRVFKRPS